MIHQLMDIGGKAKPFPAKAMAVCATLLLGSAFWGALPVSAGARSAYTHTHTHTHTHTGALTGANQVATFTLKGTVVDQNGETIIGVRVSLVEDPTKGTMTDIDGNFSLPGVKVGQTIEVAFVGYTTRQIKIADQNPLNIRLSEDEELLDEVVVIGYGTQKKVDVVGSIAQVEGKELTKKSSANLENALTGMMSGVTVIQRSGAPGREDNSIQVRGVGSFGADSAPLVLIDGIPGRMQDVNSNDVQSISVLKDASTAAIYGSRAANGVILITTKKAGSEGVNVSYNGCVGWNSATTLPEFVPTWEYAELLNEATGTPTYSKDEIQAIKDGSRPDEFANENYLRSLFKPSATRTEHHLNVTGKSDKMQYYLSGGAMLQDGLVDRNSFNRYDGRANLSVDLSDKLSLSANIHALVSRREEPNTPAGEDVQSMDDIILKALRFPGVKPTRTSSGEWGVGPEMHGTPLAWIQTPSFLEEKRFSTKANLTLRYKPIEQLELMAMGGLTHLNYEFKRFRSTMNLDRDIKLGPATLMDEMYRNFYRTFQSTISYADTFGGHSLSLLAGYSYEDSGNRWVSAYRDNIVSNDLPYINTGSPDNQQGSGSGSEWALQSLFGRIDYNYRDKYLLEFTMRYDGSSRFPPTHRYAFFPSAALGWRISEEEFFKEQKALSWISMLKLKASVGVLGNQNIGDYPYQTVYQLGQNYPFGNSMHQGAAVTTSTDNNLTWESTKTWDAGFESSFLDGAITLNVNYFNRSTYDILFSPGGSVSKVLGLGISPVNTGTLLNRGWEFELGHRYAVGDFSWNLNGNLSLIHNEIISLGVGNVEQLNGLVGSGSLYIGYPMQIYYGYQTDGVFLSTDKPEDWADQSSVNPSVKPGDIRYVDISGPDGKPDGKVDANYDRTILGSRIPKVTYSLSGNFAWKFVDFSFQLQGIAKVSGYLNNFAGYAFYQEGNIQRWQADGRYRPDAETRYPVYPRLEAIPNAGTFNTVMSDFWIRDASYLRLRNVQVGFNLPDKWLKPISIKSLRVYLSGDNLLTLSKYPKGWDPELNTGGAFYPIQKTYTVGVNIDF